MLRKAPTGKSRPKRSPTSSLACWSIRPAAFRTASSCGRRSQENRDRLQARTYVSAQLLDPAFQHFFLSRQRIAPIVGDGRRQPRLLISGAPAREDQHPDRSRSAERHSKEERERPRRPAVLIERERGEIARERRRERHQAELCREHPSAQPIRDFHLEEYGAEDPQNRAANVR